MNALPYVDQLFKEYLLFRGFTGTIQAFNSDLAGDKGQGFQADQITSFVFSKLIRQGRGRELLDLLDFLNARVYCKLDTAYEPTIRKLKVSVIKYLLVHAHKAGKLNDIKSFFLDCGETLIRGPDAAEWSAWFALPYISSPASHPTFQAYFKKEWAQLVEASFRNFLAEAIEQLPLPTVLRFDADRQQRLELQEQCRSLQKQNAQLKQALNQRVHGNAALSVTESGKFSLVDHILQEDYSQAPTPLPPKAPLLSTSRQLQPVKWPTSAPEARPGAAELAVQASQEGSSLPMRMSGEDSESRLLDVSGLSIAQGQPGTSPRVGTQEVQAMGRHSPDQKAGISRLPHPVKQSAGGSTPPSSVSPVLSQLNAWPSNGIASAPEGSRRAASSGGEPAAARVPAKGAPKRSPRGAAEGATGLLGHVGQEETRPDITLQVEELSGHEAPVVAAAFSPGGQNVATADRAGVVRIWAPESLAADEARAAVLLTGAPVTALSWDTRADKIMLVGTSGKGMRAWHVDTKRMVAHMRLEPLYPDVWDVACSPTEPTIACASSAPQSQRTPCGKLSLWNMRTFKRVHSFSLEGDARTESLAFSCDGRLMLTVCSDGRGRLFDGASRAEVLSWEAGKAGDAVRIARGKDDRSLVTMTSAGALQWWDTAQLKEPTSEFDASEFCSSKHPSGRHDFAGNAAADAFILTSLTGQVPVLHSAGDGGLICELAGSHKLPVTAVDWHPQMNVVISASADCSASLRYIDL